MKVRGMRLGVRETQPTERVRRGGGTSCHTLTVRRRPLSVRPSGQGDVWTLADQKALSWVLHWCTVSAPRPVDSPFLTFKQPGP